MIFFILFIGIILFFINFLITQSDRNLSSFECGVQNTFDTRPSFSLHFFTVGVIFILFDLEIVLLLFFIFGMKSLNLLFLFGFIILFVFLTLLFEWWSDSISWLN